MISGLSLNVHISDWQPANSIWHEILHHWVLHHAVAKNEKHGHARYQNVSVRIQKCSETNFNSARALIKHSEEHEINKHAFHKTKTSKIKMPETKEHQRYKVELCIMKLPKGNYSNHAMWLIQWLFSY